MLVAAMELVASVTACRPSVASATVPLDVAPVAVTAPLDVEPVVVTARLDVPPAVLTTPLDAASAAAACGARAPLVNMGLDPWLVAGPSAPMVHEAAAARASGPWAPHPPPLPPAEWLAPSTPRPTAEASGPSHGTPGSAPVPMRCAVNEEEALGFVSTPSGASGVVRFGARRSTNPAVRA